MSKYTDLITSEHADKPNYMAMVALITGAWVDEQLILAEFVPSYDLDLAVGTQLDICGQWIGLTRIVQVPLTGAYFSFDLLGSGFDEKPWYHTGNPLFTSVSLDDDAYRRLLKAKALANRWDGTINGAYAVYDLYFTGLPTAIKIHDYQNMTMALEITGTLPDDTTLSILKQDYLGLRPAGVTFFPLVLP